MTPHVFAETDAIAYRVAIDAAGHPLVADEAPALGGQDAGPAPFTLVLAGLAACTGITLRMYAVRKGWSDVALSVDLRLVPGRTRHTIKREVLVRGAPSAEAISRLRDIVERTPVTLALKSGFDIATHLDAALDGG
jgi:putative redox protein